MAGTNPMRLRVGQTWLGDGQGEIAHGGKARAAGNGGAVHRSNRGQRKIVNAVKDASHARDEFLPSHRAFSQQGLQLVEVHAAQKACPPSVMTTCRQFLRLIKSSQQLFDQPR